MPIIKIFKVFITGLVFHHYSHAAEWVDDINEMFYYKKDTIVCGTPDTSTALSVNEYKINENILLYPNPFCTQTTLHKDKPFHNATLTVDNCFGNYLCYVIFNPNYALIAQRSFADFARGFAKHSSADGRIGSGAIEL